MYLIRRILQWGSAPPEPPTVETHVRVRVGDVSGRITAELELEVGPVAWLLNEASQTTMRIAASDAKATSSNLNFGNRVLIDFDNGLPTWGGIIEPPRHWTADGVIEFTVYSAEKLLEHWRTDKSRLVQAATRGWIARSLVEDASAAAASKVVIGEVWEGGETFSPEYHYDNVLEKIQELVSDSPDAPGDFDVTASESAGYIVFTFNFYERRGRSRPGVALLEDHNLAQVELLEQGPIVNWWAIPGEGSEWGDDRLVGTAQDEDSAGDYGLRQACEVRSDVADQGSLDEIAADRLAESKDPHNMLALEAVNLAPGSFSSYEVGDSVRVVAPSFGFGGYNAMCRVVGREYDPNTGVCRLVVREDA